MWILEHELVTRSICNVFLVNTADSCSVMQLKASESNDVLSHLCWFYWAHSPTLFWSSEPIGYFSIIGYSTECQYFKYSIISGPLLLIRFLSIKTYKNSCNFVPQTWDHQVNILKSLGKLETWNLGHGWPNVSRGHLVTCSIRRIQQPNLARQCVTLCNSPSQLSLPFFPPTTHTGARQLICPLVCTPDY